MARFARDCRVQRNLRIAVEHGAKHGVDRAAETLIELPDQVRAADVPRTHTGAKQAIDPVAEV